MVRVVEGVGEELPEPYPVVPIPVVARKPLGKSFAVSLPLP